MHPQSLKSHFIIATMQCSTEKMSRVEGTTGKLLTIHSVASTGTTVKCKRVVRLITSNRDNEGKINEMVEKLKQRVYTKQMQI